ncbi:acetoacetate-CoA ligase [Meredithblackwellia eburnea MCA 4105]
MSSTDLRACQPDSNLYWLPTEERSHQPEPCFLTTLIHDLDARKGLGLRDFWGLHKWSVEKQSDFWDEMWSVTGIVGDRGNKEAYVPTSIEKEQDWFPGARLNYAENVLFGHPNSLTNNPAVISTTEPEGSSDIPPVIGTLTWRELHDAVRAAASALKQLGVGPGDRVASYSASNAEVVVGFLAANSLGAIYSSAPVEFGPVSVIDRFSQIKPKVIFSIDSTRYNGKHIDVIAPLEAILARLETVEHVVIIGHKSANRVAERFPTKIPSRIKAHSWQDFMALGKKATGKIEFWRGPFQHPIWVVFSSGTTGKPKAIVHSAGGVLLPRKVVARYHINLDHRDVCLQFCTLAWIMYNISLTFMANGCTLVTYDGSPFKPIGCLWSLVEQHKVSYFGTSPRYLQALDKAGYYPNERVNVSSLKVVAPTGAPVTQENYNFVAKRIKRTYIFNGSGGTEIASSFVSGVPTLPIYKGEIQVPTLGVAAECMADDLKFVRDGAASLVVTRAFPNMPLGFLNDPDRKRYMAEYFEDFSKPVWSQKDYCRIASNTGGITILGRSDGILNPGGVRFGSAEIYNIVEMFPEEIEESICVGQRIEQDERVVLFLKTMHQKPLTPDLVARLRKAIVANLSVRHVPAVICQVSDIPVTANAKKVETYVKKLLNGQSLEKLNTAALVNPECLKEYMNHPAVQLSKPKL